MSNWTPGPIVTADYTASPGELVRVDMSGKVAPDVLTIKLPPPALAPRGICVITVNPGGAENGSWVRIGCSSATFPQVGATAKHFDTTGEVFMTLEPTATEWLITSKL